MPEQTQPMATSFSVGQRTRGLNQIARLRALYRDDGEKALRTFFASMRDKRDPLCAQNCRALSALLFLAGIPACRHGLALEAFSVDEKTALIVAMNQCRAMVSLFPRRLSLPQQP